MLKEITLKEAVILAQHGDNDALIALLKKYQPLVAKGIGKGYACGVDKEDLESIFLLKFITAIHNFDITKLK